MCPVPSEIILSPERSATPSPPLLYAVLQDTVLFQARQKEKRKETVWTCVGVCRGATDFRTGEVGH